MRVVARPPAGSKNRKLRCAWHSYLFDARTGRSADGSRLSIGTGGSG
jgi:nitrite reductase/ring-hydroxylating ferredoxin subunit